MAEPHDIGATAPMVKQAAQQVGVSFTSDENELPLGFSMVLIRLHYCCAHLPPPELGAFLFEKRLVSIC
jgi:hypothetical protein